MADIVETDRRIDGRKVAIDLMGIGAVLLVLVGLVVSMIWRIYRGAPSGDPVQVSRNDDREPDIERPRPRVVVPADQASG